MWFENSFYETNLPYFQVYFKIGDFFPKGPSDPFVKPSIYYKSIEKWKLHIYMYAKNRALIYTITIMEYEINYKYVNDYCIRIYLSILTYQWPESLYIQGSKVR